MTADGPVAIDWFDASIGHPVGDVVRSSLLMRPFGDRGDPQHLPGADPAMLTLLHHSHSAAALRTSHNPGPSTEAAPPSAVHVSGIGSIGNCISVRHRAMSSGQSR